MNERFFKCNLEYIKPLALTLLQQRRHPFLQDGPVVSSLRRIPGILFLPFFINKNLKKHAEILFSTPDYYTQQRVQEKIFLIVYICFNF